MRNKNFPGNSREHAKSERMAEDLPPDVAQILRGGLKSRAPTEREIAVRQLSAVVAGCREYWHKQVLAA